MFSSDWASHLEGVLLRRKTVGGEGVSVWVHWLSPSVETAG